MTKPADIIQFWYSEPINKHWFASTAEIDSLIREQYAVLWQRGAEGSLDDWKQSAEGCLALILLFDQFPLNMYRGSAKSFATETTAIELTLYGIENAYDMQLPASQLNFFYMPLMHSELLAHQNLSIEKFEQAGLDANARFAKHHHSLIQRFGRFPHRNDILGRRSSPEEREYLDSKEAFTG